MTWKELLKKGECVLQEADIADASLDAWYLLEYVSERNRAGYFMHQEDKVPLVAVERYQNLVKRRSCHIPLQHLTGRQEFMGLEFQVSPEVLIPRQDTELLVEKLLPLVSGKRVLDLCTGSGCIAVSLSVLGTPLEVTAIDLSEKALLVARKNAEQLQAKVDFIQSNLFDHVTKKYDVIVSNPPYIATEVVKTLMPEVREYEPSMALDGGPDGLDFYRQIAIESRKYLNSGGMVWLEIGYDQRVSVSRLFQEQGFKKVACYQDLCGMDRVISAK